MTPGHGAPNRSAPAACRAASSWPSRRAAPLIRPAGRDPAQRAQAVVPAKHLRDPHCARFGEPAQPAGLGREAGVAGPVTGDLGERLPAVGQLELAMRNAVLAAQAAYVADGTAEGLLQ